MNEQTRGTRFRVWGISDVMSEWRGATVERVELRATVAGYPVTVKVIGPRAAFTVECRDCGPSPHVCVDDHSVAVCLRCGLDRWL